MNSPAPSSTPGSDISGTPLSSHDGTLPPHHIPSLQQQGGGGGGGGGGGNGAPGGPGNTVTPPPHSHHAAWQDLKPPPPHHAPPLHAHAHSQGGHVQGQSHHPGYLPQYSWYAGDNPASAGLLT